MYKRIQETNKVVTKKLIREHKAEYDRIDYKIILALLFLCVFGIIMIYSASAYRCSINPKFQYNEFYFAKKQAFNVSIGLITGLFIFRHVNYKWLKPFSKLLYILGVLSIFLLLTPMGTKTNNAVRWIKIGPISIQIAEVVKLCLIILLAGLSTNIKSGKTPFKTVLQFWIIGFIPALLILIVSNNLSSAIILLGISFGITFVITSWKKLHISIVVGSFLSAIIFAITLSKNLPSAEELSNQTFRLGRFAAWISPETYASGQGFQPLQGLYAVASGGFFGKGLGNGVQKLWNIPEAQNDMIFSIICEELGLFGAILLLLLFSYLLYQLLRVAISCTNLFGSTLVVAIFLHIALQVLVNLAVVLGLIPNTGASLPFISYGGTAVIFTLWEISLVLSVYRIQVESNILKTYHNGSLEAASSKLKNKRREVPRSV